MWFRSGERQIDASEMEDRALRAASGLAALGIGQADVAATLLRNDFSCFELWFATSKLGAYCTPLNWHNSPAETRYVLGDCGAKMVLVHSDLYWKAADAFPADIEVLVVETPPEIRVAYGLSDHDCRLPDDRETWPSFVARHEPWTHASPVMAGSMIYTSGTTGKPKGVRRGLIDAAQGARIFDVVSDLYGFRDWIGRPGGMTTVITGPVYHSGPNNYSIYMTYAGSNIILQPRFDAEDLLALIERHRVTHLHMVPTMFVRLLGLPKEIRETYDVSSLGAVTHTAAPCPPHVKRAMIEWWGPIIHEHYGGTEVGAVTACTSDEWLAHPGTVGRAVPSAEIRVIDEVGEELATSAVGEIVCRLKAVPDFTYHGDDEKRRRAEKYSGLISLGDVGYLDADGFLYLCDRSNDMIISGGVNIYPAEIEAELLKMDGVEDCAVFGIPNDEYGEQVHAVVVGDAELKEGAVQTFLRARIAGYKVPRSVAFVTDLPREDSGKIFKRKLREAFWQAADRVI